MPLPLACVPYLPVAYAGAIGGFATVSDALSRYLSEEKNSKSQLNEEALKQHSKAQAQESGYESPRSTTDDGQSVIDELRSNDSSDDNFLMAGTWSSEAQTNASKKSVTFADEVRSRYIR